MRCKKCHKKASVELRRHNTSFCPIHYIEFVSNQVSRNIKKHNMFTSANRVLLAVSGGKDSLALWDILTKQGYNVTGLHLKLGIGNYSLKAAEKTRAFAETHELQLIEYDLESEMGLGVSRLSKSIKRAPCSGCGLNKRYFFNKLALQFQFDVLITGHNLDDEAATLFGNVLHWQEQALSRQSPILESTHPNLVKKCKPLYTLTEREIASYCLLLKIAYQEEECPNAAGAHSLLYKDLLNRLEVQSPGSKQQFLQGFLSKIRPSFRSQETVTLNECDSCGMPTTGQVCSFCRMWERARKLTDPKLVNGTSNL
ncbi:TIGR00269 family protein [SAR202 cluster bacterium AC-409-J13_OGT_754m]|nr:TIGR00269 family protein [SAR202 cluster bacterium AC-409-J13_OGT_754m]